VSLSVAAAAGSGGVNVASDGGTDRYGKPKLTTNKQTTK